MTGSTEKEGPSLETLKVIDPEQYERVKAEQDFHARMEQDARDLEERLERETVNWWKKEKQLVDLRAQAVSGVKPLSKNEKYGENMERQKSRASRGSKDERPSTEIVEADPELDASQVQELAQLVKDSDEEDEESVDPLDDFGGAPLGRLRLTTEDLLRCSPYRTWYRLEDETGLTQMCIGLMVRYWDPYARVPEVYLYPGRVRAERECE